jgi:hypothetical protein
LNADAPPHELTSMTIQMPASDVKEKNTTLETEQDKK